MNRKFIRSCCGMSLVELIVVVAIIGLIVSVTTPAFSAINRKRELQAASTELRSIFRMVRSRAIAEGHNTAVKFAQIDGVWHYAVFDDGDGDGVRNQDIASGTDPIAVGYRAVFGTTGHAKIGLPPYPMKDPDRGVIQPEESPVKFNRSTMCSFSPLGGGTSGSIYLTEGTSSAVLRVYGPSSRLRLLMLEAVPEGSAQ